MTKQASLTILPCPDCKAQPKLVAEGGLVDIVKCECGKEGSPFFDGTRWAIQAWNKMVEETQHPEPCDGFGYKGECSMCSGFIAREDGTLVHADGSIFAPVEEAHQRFYRLKTSLFPVEIKCIKPECSASALSPTSFCGPHQLGEKKW